jgi:hypothetical protein
MTEKNAGQEVRTEVAKPQAKSEMPLAMELANLLVLAFSVPSRTAE